MLPRQYGMAAALQSELDTAEPFAPPNFFQRSIKLTPINLACDNHANPLERDHIDICHLTISFGRFEDFWMKKIIADVK